MNRELRYRDAGVDRDAASEAKRRIAKKVRSTFSPAVLQDIGSFGALYQLETGRWKEPVLVSSIDSVGTKLKVAFVTGKHDTVGIDIVAHCVNDILTMGARPLFVMDYLGVGKLEPGVVEEVIAGLVAGCNQSGCALIGGETAELPGFYAEGEYDFMRRANTISQRASSASSRRARSWTVPPSPTATCSSDWPLPGCIQTVTRSPDG